MTLQRLTALRALMASQPTALAAYIVPTADAHNSEYIARVDARREWISGFTGSAGTAVVTSSHALVWTDGRYYTQFEKEVDLTMWTLMKQSLPDTPSIEKWLSSNLSDGAVVGVDPHTMTREEWSPIQSVLSKANMRFVAVPMNLVDEVRVLLNDLPPARPHNDIMPLPVKYTGQTTGAKIEELRKKMAEKKASSLVITALDEVAYTLNLRGSDIEFNPVFFSYLVITPSAVKMFWWDGKLPSVVIDHLKEEGVGDFEVLKYNSIVDYLESEALKLSETGDGQHAVWLSSEASEAIHRAASGSDLAKKPLNLISEVSPVALAKLVKNHVELEGFRQCHVRDGVAVTRLLRWLHLQIDAGVEVTEIQVADRLLEFRKEESDFMGPSFETIAGAGENGAVIHYTPHRGGEQRVVTSTDMFLLDSGGQYRDGTTDITRTRHMGRAPSAEQKGAFTRVLKGQIMLGSALFPKGVKGNVLDSFARKALWDVGLDYAHGTGHGVGHFLNVHEGPSGVSWRPYPRDPGLAPRQVLSNEPGYYKVGEYGIRHEDLVETIDVTKDSSHPRAMNLIGEFEGRGVLGFRTLTLVPNQRECIDVALLDQFELHYTNEYHQRVLDTLGPILKARGLTEDCEWLEAECAPITRKPIFTECFTTNMAWGHIPMRYFNSAEPDAPIYEPDPSVTKLSRQTAWDRLNAVRSVLSPSGVYAYIVPTADAHNSQYIAPAEARREWLSGLQGSSGTAVVTARKALLWTDARYFTQFYVQVDTTHWELMRQGTDLSVTQWLVENLPAESVVGIDPTTYTRSAWTPLENALRQANITLLATSENLVDLARVSINDSPPSRPSNDLLPLTSNYTGRPAGEKVAELMAQMQTRGASALVLTALDEVAYTLNLRGSDIPYNPVFFAYLLIRTDVVASNVILFWNDGQLSSEVVQHLSSQDVQVEARPYAEIFQYLRTFTVELPYESAVWLSEDASHAINLAVENDGENGALNILSTVSPVALMKVVKNQVELQGFRNAHIKDGVAVVRALFWVHQQVDAGVNVTEVQLSNKMRDLRADEIDFMGPSFATIAGAGQNGAIIHYKPSDVGEQTVIRKEDMLLVDSGGQYKDGTTDITRTRHMSSSPTAAQRRAFTRVLKGQINLGTAVFPSGTQGHVIEVLARKALWDVGLNYGHGTGHGVGHYLNVHEGPTWILSGPAANDPGIRPNMIYSNEPGYYEVGEYGIRHEDLVETISITRDADHQLAAGMVADFEGRGAVGFYTISLAPHQTACLDVDLLTDFEITYINEYHARVLSTLGPILQARGLSQESEWLESECAPIGRSAAILFTLSPILAVVSVLRIVLA